MSRLRLTVTLDYDWKPEDYEGADSADEAAAIDLFDMREDPSWMLNVLMGRRLDKLKIKVEPAPNAP